MDCVTEFDIRNSDQLSYEEYHHIFKDEILQNGTCSDVHQSLLRYVTHFIEPVGWKAVWKREIIPSSSLTCDILIEVVDVSLEELEAEVRCLDYKIKSEDEKLNGKISEQINLLKQQELITAPLMELFPTLKQDPTLYLEPTIKVLDLLRFFFDNLWRPWDDELNDNTDIFADKFLETRLQLYFDAVSNKVPQITLNKIASLIAEGHTVIQKLYSLRSCMKADQENMELDEQDVLSCMELTNRLELIQKEVDMLENPLLRNLIKKQDIKYLSPKQKVKRPVGKVVTHLVGQTVTFSMIKDLQLELEEIILIHENFVAAINSSRDGDKILIFPGKYLCDGLGWIENDLTVKGMSGSNSDVVLSTTEDSAGDIFINCCTKSINFFNLTLQLTRGAVSSMLTVHHGKLNLNNVSMQCDELAIAKNGITILEDAQVSADKLSLTNFQTNGIYMNSASSCELLDFEIDGCENGICIDLTTPCKSKTTNLSVRSTRMQNISHYGLSVSTLDNKFHGPVENTDISSIDGLNISLPENAEIKGNLGRYAIKYQPQNSTGFVNHHGLNFDPGDGIDSNAN